ncbi:MAG: hypothetical protein GF375_07515 [Candidatus Omnitrophica bacterium]|nr:hypothetical protein [Candidatus Omnitrophota bacterium]MBD3269818.1 hypothetical protein [Candidatus Omnitrophota bacterium]
MKAARVIIMGCFMFFMAGCFAVVDERGDERRIKAVIISSEETNDLLNKVEGQEPHAEYDLRPFQKPENKK